jgi:tetratricopeptide (TPR) repeat protein
MTTLLEDIQSELNEMTFVLDFAKHGCWIFALYNQATPRADINRLLEHDLKLPVIFWSYDDKNQNPVDYLKQLSDEQKQQRALIIFTNIMKGGDNALQAIDQSCDVFAQYPHSLLFWFTEEECTELGLKAEHFWALRRGIFDFCREIKEEKEQEKVVPEEKIAQTNPVGSGRWLNSLLVIENHQNALEQLEHYQNVIDEYKNLDVTKLLKKYASKYLPVAESYDNVAYLFYYLGRYPEAITYCQSALSFYEKLLGEKFYPNTLACKNNLAVLYVRVNRYLEAEQLLESLATILEKRKERFAEYATVLTNLASVYCAEGLREQAKPLYEQSLSIRKENLPADHPDIASGLNDLAMLYYAEGDYEKVEHLFKASLSILEKSLGTDHFIVAGCLNNLGRLFEKQGRLSEAEPLLLKSLAIKEKVLGQNHPSVAGSLNNLASLHQAQGKYTEAELEYNKSLAIREEILGLEHPQVASSLNNLAILYGEQQQYEQAELLHQRAVAIAEQSLGKFHFDTRRYKKNYQRLLAIKSGQAFTSPPH